MKTILPLLLLGFSGILANTADAKLTPTSLTCEYLYNPPVVDVLQPRLAWINVAEPGERSQQQTAWQVRVAGSASKLDTPDLWDSGKQVSQQSTRVVYGGKPLASRRQCWWQVRVWDRDGKVSAWSEPTTWAMGLLQPSDWKAEWIGAPWQGEAALPKPKGGPNARPTVLPPPAPLLRKEFTINKKVVRAVAYVTGLGYFELYVNGKRVGNDQLIPNQTNYGKRPALINGPIPLKDNFREYKVMYLAYDIKDYLTKRDNVVGSILGNGFYNAPKFWTASYGSPRFLAQIHITFDDGTEQIIKSDRSWKASKSAIMMDLVYHGEHYDARKEQPGWCTAGFDDADWLPVAKRRAPYGHLVAHTAQPDRVTKRIAPISIERTPDGTYKVDFGVEISGRLRLNHVKGPAGHKIEIKYICNTYSGDNSYIFRGDGPESYAARFNWFVFSAVEIRNWPGKLTSNQVTAEAVNTYIEETAVFETSNQLLDDINKIWKRSQLDNMHGGIASDCPHRERSPYTGDGEVSCVTVMHNFDARSFYHKWIQDIFGAQNVDTGYVPNGAPWQPGCGGGVAWGAAMCIMPWEFYVHYGDLDMLQDNYDGMKGYIRYMQKWVDDDGIMFSQATGRDGKPLKWMNLGEWLAPGKTMPDDMVHTFYFWYCADLTARTAKALGKNGEARRYAKLADRTRRAFAKKYYDAAHGTYGKGGGNILALKMGVPADQHAKVVVSLRADIAAAGGHLDTGICGTRFFFEVLADNGMQDLAYEAMNKRTWPSYGYWLEQGATTSRENWNDDGSHNHPMFGGGLVWFYRRLAGMRADPLKPGYRHILFRPQPVNELAMVTYSNETPFGTAGITWRQRNGIFRMDVRVPVGSTATVYVPAKTANTVTESGRQPDASDGVTFQRMETGFAVYRVGSGEYSFQVRTGN